MTHVPHSARPGTSAPHGTTGRSEMATSVLIVNPVVGDCSHHTINLAARLQKRNGFSGDRKRKRKTFSRCKAELHTVA